MLYESHSVHVKLFATPWTVACQALLSMEFSRPEHWSEQWFPSPGDPPNLAIKPRPPALQADSSPDDPPRKPRCPETELQICERFIT